jgi:alkylation response protein AidB-like acyl-CoA dehydrogenase
MPIPSEETELLHASAQRLFSRRRLRTGRSADLQTWRELVELGWLSAHVPKDHGGLEMRMTDSLVLFEEAGRSLLVDPIIPGIAAAAALA